MISEAIEIDIFRGCGRRDYNIVACKKILMVGCFSSRRLPDRSAISPPAADQLMYYQ